MAKRVNKLIIVLVVFIVVIVGAVVAVSLLSKSQGIVNSVAFGYYDKEEEAYKRFFYKEIYMTGSEEDNVDVKVFVNESTELSTTDINWSYNKEGIVKIKQSDKGFVFVPISEGEVVITVTSKENTNAVDSCTISIKQKSFSEITVTKINNVEVTSTSNELKIYNISESKDNGLYNQVFLNLNSGNASSLEILKYDSTRIEDIYIDTNTFSLQIRTKNFLGPTLVKLGWKELDANGDEKIVGQQDFVFNICSYVKKKIGFKVYTEPNFEDDGYKLQELNDLNSTTDYNVNLGTDMDGNIYKILYVKPYYIYSSGWENYDITISPNSNSICSTYTIGNGETSQTYYIINFDNYTTDCELTFSNAEYSTISAKLKITYKNGNFEAYFD